MNRSLATLVFLLLTLAISALAAPAGADDADADAQPIVVGKGEPQLFVDDLLIDRQTDLRRTLHQPKKDHGGERPIIALEDEYGGFAGTLEANGTILYDPRLKKWVMFAISFSSEAKGPDRIRIYRFTSPDAMKWVKGDDGAPQHIRFDLKDEASGRSATNTDLFSCYYDTSDTEYPYKGWLWFANWGDDLEGIYFVRSRDGKTWERGRQIMQLYSRHIRQDGRHLKGPSDVTIFSVDPMTDRFLALIKFVSHEPVGPKNLLRSRAFAFVDALDQPFDMNRIDHVELLPAAAEANGDLPHDEYYGSTAWRYGSHWLGGLKVWHGGGNYPYSAAGCAFLKFVSSPDGLNWEKVQFANDSGVPEVFIANGPEGGNGGRNDGGYMTEFSNPPLRIGDELIIYYGASSYGKNHPGNIRVSGGGIFRARLRPDGFVSVDGGSLTTKPLAFEGQELFVNTVGPVVVEAIAEDGSSIAKTVIEGDSLQHPVRFGDKELKAVLPGDTGRLRFTVGEGGQLYSFSIR